MKIDVIGDIHGCIDELHKLFSALGYHKKHRIFIHPGGRIPVFLGDITDRGPDSLAVIKLVYEMVVIHRKAKYVPGNHCNKLYRYFLGNKVHESHGLETTIAEYKTLPEDKQKLISDKFMELYEQAPLYLMLPEVNTIVAHAGIKASYIGRTDKKVKTFVLYGDITGKFDKGGRPIRLDWAKHYRGGPFIVYGHTPVMKPRKMNNTINIDTGCVFGNKLTAFSMPEEKTTSIPSKQPFVPAKFTHYE